MPGPTLTIRDRIKNLCPPWLREAVGERLMYSFGLATDALLDKLTQGELGRMPTRCDPSFLPIIAGERVVVLGPTEPVASQRRRLQTAFDAWQIAGSARSALSEVLPVLLPYQPMVREVSYRFEADPARIPLQVAQGMGLKIQNATNASPIAITTYQAHGLTTGRRVRVGNCAGNTAANNSGGSHWVITVTGDRTFTLTGSTGNGAYSHTPRDGNFMAFPTTYQPARLSSTWDTYEAGQDAETAPVHVYAEQGDPGDWNWDSSTQEPQSWMWGEIFVVLFAVAPQDFANPPTWLIGDASLEIGSLPGSIGLDVDADYVENIRTVLRQRKAGNTVIRHIIICFNAALFDPAQPADGISNPDGTFGQAHKLVSGNWTAARFEDAAYCDGVS